MKRRFVFVLCIIYILSMAACSSGTTSTNDKEEQRTEESKGNTFADNITPAEEECKHTYDEEVYKEAGYGYDGMLVKSCTICHDMEYLPIPALPNILEVRVTEKEEYMEGTTSYVFFDLEIENTSDKKIESVKGTLVLMPPTCIMNLSCEFNDLSLGAYETAVIHSYGFSFEENDIFYDANKKVYDAELDTISYHFEPSGVVVEE